MTSERLEAIVAAAEQAAAKVIDEAEGQAKRHLAEAEGAFREKASSLAAATDSLIAQAEDIRRRSDRLLEALEEVRAELERASGGASGSEPADRPRSHLSAVVPVEEDEHSPERGAEPRPGRESPAGARLLATQMAVSGSSRQEIASRLRNGFEIEDTDAILDAILGPEE
jgi:hypothetical protein